MADIAKELSIRNHFYHKVSRERQSSQVPQALQMLFQAIKDGKLSLPELKAMAMGIEQALEDNESW